MISLKNASQIAKMREAGKILREVEDEVREHIRPGVSTAELDILAERLIRKHDAIPSSLHYHGYPCSICASINYFVALYVGRPVVYRFANSKRGKICLLNQEKVERSEKYFDDHGIAATLTGRFVPVIRHLISIPAGLARMNYGKFILFTTIGAGGWHSVLAALGWYLHAIVPEDQLNDKISEYAEYIKIVILALIVAAIVYFSFKAWVKKKQEKQA